MYVAVTGSAGKLGRAAVSALRSGGHRVVGLDIAGPRVPTRSLHCDCTDFGAVMGALSGATLLVKGPMRSFILQASRCPGWQPISARSR